jgi:mRNA interferase MazF
MSDFEPPSRVKPRLRAAPKIREFFWCDFPSDAQLPEFWKTRPVIIVSKRSILSGATVVIPCTTDPQAGNKWAFELSFSFDGRKTWAICDKPSTVAVSRLSSDKGGIHKMDQEEFNCMLSLLYKYLPSI